MEATKRRAIKADEARWLSAIEVDRELLPSTCIAHSKYALGTSAGCSRYSTEQ